ncbi:MAG: hypothetical protein ABNH53_14250 [Henriciella sp.]|jgi:hypothetical protein
MGRLAYYVIGSGVVGIVGSLVTFNALIGSNFDTMNARITDQKTHVSEQFSQYTDRTAEVLDEMSETVAKLDADIQFIREFATEIENMDDKVGYGPALIGARLERLPVGGPGSIPVPEFPTYTFEITLQTERSIIERRREELKELLLDAVVSDRRYNFDANLHDVIVFENVVMPLDAEKARLDLTAIVIFKQQGIPQ